LLMRLSNVVLPVFTPANHTVEAGYRARLFVLTCQRADCRLH
jgi:hypothetical protein